MTSRMIRSSTVACRQLLPQRPPQFCSTIGCNFSSSFQLLHPPVVFYFLTHSQSVHTHTHTQNKNPWLLLCSHPTCMRLSDSLNHVNHSSPCSDFFYTGPQASDCQVIILFIFIFFSFCRNPRQRLDTAIWLPNKFLVWRNTRCQLNSIQDNWLALYKDIMQKSKQHLQWHCALFVSSPFSIFFFMS